MAENSGRGWRIRVLSRNPRLLWQLQLQPSQSPSPCLSLPALKTWRSSHVAAPSPVPHTHSTFMPVTAASSAKRKLGPFLPWSGGLSLLPPDTLKPSHRCWSGRWLLALPDVEVDSIPGVGGHCIGDGQEGGPWWGCFHALQTPDGA